MFIALIVLGSLVISGCNVDNSLLGTIKGSPSLDEVLVEVSDGASRIKGGASATLTWEAHSSQANQVDIEVSSDGGNTWTLVESGVVNSGSYQWSSVPSANSSGYRLRLKDSATGENLGHSELFSIDSIAPSTPSVLNLSEPTMSPGADPTPTIEVSPVEDASTVRLYSDPACATEVGQALSTGTLVDVTVNSLTDGAYTFYATTEDDVGNISSCTEAENSLAYVLDTTPPAEPTALTLNTPSSSPGNDPTPTIEVSGVTAGDTVTLYSDSSCSNLVASETAGGTTIDLTSLTLLDGTYEFHATAADNLGNSSGCSSASEIYELDTQAPTATLSNTPSDPSNVGTLNVNVAGTDVATYYYKVGVTDTTDCASATGYGSQVNESTNITDNISALADGSITLCVVGEDGLGNLQSYASATSYSWTKNTDQPTVTITSSESDPTNASPIPVTIDFSETVTGFVVGDISVTNGTAGNFVSVTGSQYTADITPSADGAVSIDVAAGVAQDADGSSNTAATQLSVTYDTTAPTATLSGTPSDPSNVTTLDIDVTGTDVVAYYYKIGVDSSTDCSSSTGYSSLVSASTNITNDISGLADGSIEVCVVGEDSAGNSQAYASATSASWVKDTAKPSVTITSSESDPTNASPIPVTIDFSENVTGFAVGDISVTNGAAGNFVSVTGSQYTADITPSADGTVSVDIAADVAQDGASNNNTAATQFSLTYDSSAPTATLSSTPSDPSNVTSLNIDVAGTDVVAYYYKVGVTGSTDCTSSTGYSSQVAEATHITDDISALSDVSITTCVVGEDSAGNIQAYASATSYSWTKDTSQPTVTITSSESDPTNANPIPITIDFSESVTGFAVGDITVTNGSAGNFVSVSGSQYTADITPSADGTVSVDVAASVAQDTAGNNNTAATQFSLTYDGSAPTATLTGSPSDPDNWTDIYLEVGGSGVSTYDYKMVSGDVSVCSDSTDYHTGFDVSTPIYHDISSLPDGEVTVCVVGKDSAGNAQAYASATSITWTKDTAQPSATVTSTESGSTNSNPIPVTIDFSENVTGFEVGDIAVTNGSAGNFVSVSGSQYTADITPSADGTVSVDIAADVAQDGASNNNTAATQFSLTYDSSAPTATLSSTPSDPSNVTSLNIDVAGTDVVAYYYKVEEIGTVDCSDPVGYSASVDATQNITDSIVGMSDGDVTVCVVGEDNAGNTQAYASATTYTWTKDTTKPTLTITTAEGDPTNSSPFSVTFTFSEDVTGFALGDISVTNGTAGNFATVNASQYTADITPAAEGSVSVDVASDVAQDGASNTNTAATQLSVTYDTTAPTATLSGTPSDPSNVTTLNIDVGGTDVVAYYYKVGTNSLTDCSSSTGYSSQVSASTNITNDISGLADGSIEVCVIGEDSAGNPQAYASATSATWVKDTSQPTVTITSSESGSTNANPIPITIDFSENVSGFVVGDITVSNGTAGNFVTVNASQYTADITPTADGSVTVDVASAVAQDGAGNNNTAATQLSITYDATAPVTFTVDDGQYMASTSSSPSISWTAATDDGSGLDHYEYAIGTTAGGSDVVGWTSHGTSTSVTVTGMTLSTNTTYYATIKAVDAAGNAREVQGDGWIADTTAPGDPSDLSLGATESTLTRSPEISWAAATDTAGGSGISGYEVQVHAVADGSIVSAWTAISSGSSAVNLDLTHLSDYYAQIRSVDNAGNTSGGVQTSQWQARSMSRRFVKMSVGQSHTCGLRNSGQAYCWGHNGKGQLGDDTITYRSSPVAVNQTNLAVNTSFVQLSTGWLFTCGLASDGKVYCWGRDHYGELGNGGTVNEWHKPGAINNGSLAAGSSFIQINSGEYHSCGVTDDGTAYCWGRENYGQLGDGGGTTQDSDIVQVDMTNVPSGSRFIQVEAGAFHSCGLTDTGTVYCWGRDNNHQLGDSVAGTDTVRPGAVDMSGLPTGFGFSQISTNDDHTCALGNDGEIYCWGVSGTWLNSDVPTQIDSSILTAGTSFVYTVAGEDQACGLTNDGKIYCWGDDSLGQLGDDTSLTAKNTPVAVDTSSLTSGASFVHLAGAFQVNCGVTSDSVALCWGENDNGQIGNGTTAANQPTPARVDTSSQTDEIGFLQTHAGEHHSCGLTSDGRVYCWGRGSEGQRGDGTSTATQDSPVLIDASSLSSETNFIQVGVGEYHSCALTSEGQIYCWGSDSVGQLGDSGGAGGTSLTPALVSTTNLSSGVGFVQLAVGGNHTCGIVNSGAAYCWGTDGSGQLGISSSNANQDEPAVTVDTSQMSSGTTFYEITAGYSHTCALASDGKAYCWGDDTSGQLGDDGVSNLSYPAPVDMSGISTSRQVVQISAGRAHTCALTSDELAYCWGDDTYAQLGDGGSNANKSVPALVDVTNLTSGASFAEIKAGGNHSCGVSGDGKAYCWGTDSSGQLGYSSASSEQAIPVIVDTSNFTSSANFTRISTGGSHSCGIANSGTAYCWGSDTSGKLGDGGGVADKAIPTVLNTSF